MVSTLLKIYIRRAAAEWGGPKVNFNWESPDSLIIELHKDARIFHQSCIFKGTKIIYKTFD